MRVAVTLVRLNNTPVTSKSIITCPSILQFGEGQYQIEGDMLRQVVRSCWRTLQITIHVGWLQSLQAMCSSSQLLLNYQTGR